MKSIVHIAAVVFSLALAASAQDVAKKVEQIRAACIKVDRQIAKGAKDRVSGLHFAAWTVGGKADGRQWPGVGTMEMRDELWFERGDGGGDEEEPAIIRKLVSTYRGAADLHLRIEYCYGEDGEPLFILSNSDLEPDGKIVEMRFYFDDSKLVRVVRGKKAMDANFSPADTKAADDALNQAKKLQKRYSTLIAGIE